MDNNRLKEIAMDFVEDIELSADTCIYPAVADHREYKYSRSAGDVFWKGDFSVG